MKLTNLPSEFQKALPILEKIKAAGFEAYFVGGSVRDALLNRPIHDVDIATSSYPQETKAIFPRTVDIGIEHGTVLVLENGDEYEVTTFRTEDVYVDYRRPSSVSFVRSLEEDLKRRDFTVNAFALDETAQVIDLFDGLTDLDNRVLRAVGVPSERFNEDALRIMRGFRFATSLDFDIEPTTLAAMVETSPLLEKISVERVFIEFDKLLMAPHWKKGLTALLDSGALTYLPDLKGLEEGGRNLMENLSSDFVFTSSEQAWATLLYAIQLPDAKSFLKKWKTSNDFQKQVVQLVEIFQLRETEQVTKEICYRYGKEMLDLVEEVRMALGLAVDFERIAAVDAALIIHDRHEIVINGGQLMKELDLKPGPALGRLLNQVEAAIVAGSLANEGEAILAFVEKELKNE